MAADGRVTVVVANANPFTVRATLSGATAKAVVVGRKRPRVALKARILHVAPAASKAITLQLPAMLRSLLRRQGKLSLRLQAKLRDPACTTRVVTKAVAPRAAVPTADRPSTASGVARRKTASSRGGSQRWSGRPGVARARTALGLLPVSDE